MRSVAYRVVDGHNDLPWQLRASAYDLDRVDIARPQPQLHTDLPRLRRGGLGAQFWSVFVPCAYTGGSAVTATLEQIDAVYELITRYPDDLALVTHAEGLREVLAEGRRVGCLLGAEGGHSIDDSLGTLRSLYRLGVRYLTLTHNENTAWADSATDSPAVGGLSDFGRQVVREMNRLGMLVDLSHVAATTMADALDETAAPVIFSHSSARAVCDHPRNVPDEILLRLPDNGGVVMVTFVPPFVNQQVCDWQRELQDRARAAGVDVRDLTAMDAFVAAHGGTPPRATVSDVVAHLEHIRELVGIHHLGLGGDFDGVTETPTGLADVASYPVLFEALTERGWSRDDLRRLAQDNICRVLGAAEDVAVQRRDRRPELAPLAPPPARSAGAVRAGTDEEPLA